MKNLFTSFVFTSFVFLAACQPAMPKITDLAKLDERATELCKGLADVGTADFKQCFDKTRAYAISLCTKPTTSQKFCNNHGLSFHPNAPVSSIDEDGFNIDYKDASSTVKTKVKAICSDIFKAGTDMHTSCLNEKMVIYKNECSKPINKIHLDNFKKICKNLNSK